jgi:hypothetical protein
MYNACEYIRGRSQVLVTSIPWEEAAGILLRELSPLSPVSLTVPRALFSWKEIYGEGADQECTCINHTQTHIYIHTHYVPT